LPDDDAMINERGKISLKYYYETNTTKGHNEKAIPVN
jgi:hypothetical protein